jgi:hypothetical protein
LLGFEQPDVIIQKPLHSTHVTIWCAVSAHGILGPYFIEDEEGDALTVTQERYRDMVFGLFLQDLRRFCCARGLHMNRQSFHFSAEYFGAYCIFFSFNFKVVGLPACSGFKRMHHHS